MESLLSLLICNLVNISIHKEKRGKRATKIFCFAERENGLQYCNKGISSCLLKKGNWWLFKCGIIWSKYKLIICFLEDFSMFLIMYTISLFLIYFIDYAITLVPFFPLYSSSPCTFPPTHIPPSPLVHVHGSYM